MHVLEKARQFIYRNARPLDLARWQFHFENGGKDAVLRALSFYQNDDGGFGHGLEADSWNPHSSPIQTWAATEILRKIGFEDPSHPIVAGILRYLSSGDGFDGSVWTFTVKTNDEYPHAPWWHYDESVNKDYYNPTACLAGFLLRFAKKDSELYRLGCRLAQNAWEQLVAKQEADMHLANCYIRLYEYCRKAEVSVIDLGQMEATLRRIVSDNITKDVSAWGTGYVCRPSSFIKGKDSLFYEDNREWAEKECDYLIGSQLPDGSWDVFWSWNGYPDAWAVSKNWWKRHGIIENLLFLKGMGRL